MSFKNPVKQGINMRLFMLSSFSLKIIHLGNSLAVQWLGLGAFTAEDQARCLVRELRFCKPHCMAELENTLTYTYSYSSEVERTGKMLEFQQIFYQNKITRKNI